MKKRFTQGRIIPTLKGAEAGIPVKGLHRKYSVSDITFYTWHRKCRGMEVAEAGRLKAHEEEDAFLKKLLAEFLPDQKALKAALN